jgi:hypothetical protein
MIIGYGFNDDHVNEVIQAAVSGANLEIYVIDPLGIDVLDKNRMHPIYSPGPLISTLGPHIVGASRRSLRETFGVDLVEHAKVMSFFPPKKRWA